MLLGESLKHPVRQATSLRKLMTKKAFVTFCLPANLLLLQKKTKKGGKLLMWHPSTTRTLTATKYLPKFTPQSFFSEKVTVAMYTPGKISDLSAVLKSNECGGRYGMMPAIAYGTSIGTVQHAE